MTQRSQVHAFGAPPPQTWDDYQAGCLGTYSGGHSGDKREAFQHGMETVFNLLRNEFPSAELCKSAPQLLEALRDLADYCTQFGDQPAEMAKPARAAIAAATEHHAETT